MIWSEHEDMAIYVTLCVLITIFFNSFGLSYYNWKFVACYRLRNSSVLVAGLSGCGAEVAKNLMLAGLKSLTLLDHLKVRILLSVQHSAFCC